MLVVTDHGFIHWTASEEKSIAVPRLSPAFASRRAPPIRRARPPGPSALAPRGQVARRRGQGRLQLPCLWRARLLPRRGFATGVGHPVREDRVAAERQAGWNRVRSLLPQVLGQRPRVTLDVVRSSILIEESIPRQVDVVVRDAAEAYDSLPIGASVGHTRPGRMPVTVTVVPGVVAAAGTRAAHRGTRQARRRGHRERRQHSDDRNHATGRGGRR